MITLNEILEIESIFLKLDNNSYEGFTGVSIDSRTVKPGEIFVAIKGENTDGHNYINNIIKKNVSAIMVNLNWYKRNKEICKNITYIVVKDTIKSLGELAKIHLNINRIPVLCVSGSNGKTTTKDLIALVLSNKFNVLKTEGNYNNHIGLPLTLLRLNKKHDFCVLEAGSNHFNELEYLCKIANPDFALVTNIGKEHLEFFKDLNGVAKEEFSLYDYIIKNNPYGVCFMNFDDEFVRNYYKENKPSEIFSYSYKYNTNVKGKFLEYSNKFEPVIEVKYKSRRFRVRISTFGKHSVYNGIAAIATGLYFGINPKEIINSLKNYIQISSKRMEVIRNNGKIIINDSYNSNPDSVKLGLETIKEYKTKSNKHIVLADMLELGKSSKAEHILIGKYIAKLNFKNLYTYGNEAKNIFNSAKSIKNNFYFNSKEDLGKFLSKRINKGDIIYMKGSRGMKLEELLNNIN